jgi:eukaryotic-like serine/threonine-protein kinase
MNKRLVAFTKFLGILFIYFFVFVASIFLTMSLLIKGDEIETPNFVGKSTKDAYLLAAQKGFYLRKEVSNTGAGMAPGLIVSQFPPAESKVKEKSTIQIFVASEVASVVLPALIGKSLKNAESDLKTSRLKRGNVTYISTLDQPVDTVIAQSHPAGSRSPENCSIDLLLSKGSEPPTYIMPDVIGKEASRIRTFFESKGLRISRVDEISYYGLKPGFILKQYPAPGFEISPRNAITIQVSK